jgi:hypothetical protein
MSPSRRRSEQQPLDEPRVRVASAIAEVAHERGVSDRTVWRWAAQMRASGEQKLPPKRRFCEHCGGPLPSRATQRRRYCRDRCRVYAARERLVDRRA